MAVSVIGYFYFYDCLTGKALEIFGLQLFVSNVKISIILTSWKAWKAIFSLENEVASTFSLKAGFFLMVWCQTCFPCTHPAKGMVLPPMASFEHCPMFWLTSEKKKKGKYNAFPRVNGFADFDGELKLNYLARFCWQVHLWSLDSSTEVTLDLFWYLEDKNLSSYCCTSKTLC